MSSQAERSHAVAARTHRPDAPLHLVFVPFLARSHFAPLAAKAASSSAAATSISTAVIVTTAHFAALAPWSVPVHAVPLRCPGGHEDFSLLPNEASSAPAFFAATEAALAPALAAAIRAHAHDGGGPVAVVSDAVLYWAPRVARDCGVPHVTFHTIGAFAAAAMVALHLYCSKVVLTDQDQLAVPGGFPHPVKISRAQVNEEALAHLPLFRAAEAQSCAVVFNSVSALEADFAAYYQSQLTERPKKVFLVGPTRAAVSPPPPRAITERDPILQWLDGRDVRTVVYVCFGSTCALGENQLRELAAGLRASGHPFVWVVPTPRRRDDTGSCMEREECVPSHAMVVAGRWAPQAEILAHRAVGGFLTHCGWNSVLEAVSAGVPLATWPLRAEQFLNEVFLVEVLRVGVRVREVARKSDLEAMVSAAAVARAVRRLMVGDDLEEEQAVAARRARSRELGAAALAAVAEGGSSCGDWARLVYELKTFHGRYGEIHRHDQCTNVCHVQMTMVKCLRWKLWSSFYRPVLLI